MKNKEEVIRRVENMSKVFSQLDLDGVLSFYEKGATLVVEPGLHVTGKASLSEAFKGFFAIKPVFEFDWHDVTISGNTAIHTGPWKMTGTDPSSGDKIEDQGLSVSVWIKKDDGSWKMVIDNPKGNVKSK